MARGQCDGHVRSLKGQAICFTGSLRIDGEWVYRKQCEERAKKRGATCSEWFSGAITVVVFGDLAGKVVTDARRAYSKKLVAAAAERESGRHVCVVDAEGFAELTAGHAAPCRKLKRAPGDRERVLVVQQTGDGVLGGPLRPRRVGRHDSDALHVDLDRLEKGTEAHERTIAALIAHLARDGVEVRTPARKAPRFDAGWARGDDVFVAEVKSLTGAVEDQQVRLGLGQVLDYAYQLRRLYDIDRVIGKRIRPVLVLERSPSSSRWAGLAESLGVLLVWGPGFDGY